ncbi:hypothetical protein MIND_00856400 [Mycena indigotica]|uniref:POP1-domain-containing protein n=1 Tax=Mycena indigotica TaxID=2126181 RepID=A0A8H6SI38_9AGAR|nr:uncharacterized protein MIND_00856400 [Mycena indigotica]KAF7299081.1 hypothetical protein MIND_00856400 [Mycena indigotica]
MSSKRQAEEQSGRDRKRQKLKDARTIPVQPNATAGPSTAPTIVQGKRLPATLDTEKFADARQFEIKAMHTSMKSANDSATHRTWQTLPRALRRRAASHNIRRMPIRLRDKARQEMKDTILKRKPLARLRPKHGKEKRVGRTESFIRRQKDKSWLETHIWHAKRMHMENMWGYRLAVTPTEKAFRPSHRASVHGSIIHDASYYATFQIRGPQNILNKILTLISDPQDIAPPGAPRYHSGFRTCETHIYEPHQYPYGFVGTATIIWKPRNLGTAQPLSKPSKKGKEKASEERTSTADMRTVWLRSHPSVSDTVFTAIKESASIALEAARATAPEDTVLEDVGIELEDISGQLNAFEIMGPKASQVLKGALTPISQDEREDFKKFWQSMSDLQSSGSLPRTMIIGLKVLDPRLKFPPKNAKPQITNTIVPIQPSSSLAQTELWDSSVRDNIRKPRYKKADIDERRSQHLVPGTKLDPLRQDDRIPVMLIQRAVEQDSSSSLSLYGWTLLVPAGWSMPFFSSLTYTGTRVAGQRERRVQAFEAGTGYFPHDYPLCATYEQVAKERETQDRTRWERTPPAKRHNYESTDTRSPWRADWEVVLGLQSSEADGLVTTQREPDAAEKDVIKPWLLRGRLVKSLVEKMIQPHINPSVSLYDELNTRCADRGLRMAATKPDALLQGALVRVKVTPKKRGNPHELAVIYFVEDEEIQLWQHHPADEFEIEDIAQGNKLWTTIPPQSDIIGYVTSGNFSLSQGSGFALGAISLSSLLRLKQQALRLKASEMVVKIRNRDGQMCRAAYIRMLD